MITESVCEGYYGWFFVKSFKVAVVFFNTEVQTSKINLKETLPVCFKSFANKYCYQMIIYKYIYIK